MEAKTNNADPWDWRWEYILCQHVADGDGNPDNTKHSGLRVCCPACYELGFLIRDIKTRQEGKLAIGTILTEEECAAERSTRIGKRLRKSGLY